MSEDRGYSETQHELVDGAEVPQAPVVVDADDVFQEELEADLRAIAGHLRAACALTHTLNQKWWHDLETGRPIERNKGEMIALMHSELSEALEAIRKDLTDDKLPHMRGETVEFADVIIRIFDFCGGFDLDLGGAFYEKTLYNMHRADHKPENRRKDGGKKF